MRKLIILSATVLALSSFVLATSSETEQSSTCTAPPAPDDILVGGTETITAVAIYFGGYPSSLDGFEWTVRGGTITGPNDGASVTIEVECDDPDDLVISVAGYNDDGPNFCIGAEYEETIAKSAVCP
ncbi:MAG TPA: hypothetical protein DCR93_25695 [Cytophagales bacterium]|nr:hypothetical protein [Cytophagales bacterium]HAP62748.1 hypothetical protein [Cytophagales bacterium]